MKDLASLRGRAIVLMREAMVLLDETGEGLAAAHLQAALDATERVPPMRPGDELDDTADASTCTSLATDPALVRAIGGALAVIAMLLSRAAITSTDEFANVLSIYATVSAEEHPAEGLALAYWAGVLRDVADNNAGS